MKISPASKKYDLNQGLSLRDFLAIDRTRLANQRTLLSYLRSGLYLFLSGLAVEKFDFLADLSHLSWIGYVLGPCVILFGTINYFLVRRRINQNYGQR